MFDLNLKNYGFVQLFVIILLNVLGLIFIQSALTTGVGNFTTQLWLSIASLIICIAISLLDLKKIFVHPVAYYLPCVISLAAVVFLGVTFGRNSQRWIEIPVINMQFQPTEFAKLFIILYFSKYIEKVDININRSFEIIKIIILFFIPFFLVFIQPNLSSSIILAVIFISMLFCSKLKTKIIMFWLAIFALFVVIILLSVKLNFIENAPILKEYQKQRIISFFTPSTKDEGKYQQENAVIAIGSGKLTGKGINNNSTQSVKNGNWLAEEQNDFIFAVVGEEVGFLGSVAIIILYIYLIVSCFIISAHQQEEYKKLICVGVGTWIGFQSFVNIGVATSLIPNTGVPLPFFSQGGSSLMAVYFAYGFVLNIRRSMR